MRTFCASDWSMVPSPLVSILPKSLSALATFLPPKRLCSNADWEIAPLPSLLLAAVPSNCASGSLCEPLAAVGAESWPADEADCDWDWDWDSA